MMTHKSFFLCFVEKLTNRKKMSSCNKFICLYLFRRKKKFWCSTNLEGPKVHYMSKINESRSTC
ncbi:hypothetical protein C2G38_606223 [Gigaspora rosea]|uniref:Uncharacterized protein n=1 Tax=Gigaspora rosea TaxID=44941 RepID=A0A397W611_9GLOM|nr:hypothetical protein C2G38_606223 [Gigaspora rosea]